jgi:multiple sugar transport system permease protein
MSDSERELSRPPSTTARSPVTRSAKRNRDGLVAMGFLAPSAASFILFVVVPTIGVLYLSLFDWNLISAGRFVGVDNFAKLLADKRLWAVYRSTAFMALAILSINVLVGLVLAVLLETRMPRLLRSSFRLAYLFPFVVSASAVALIWRFLLNKDLGALNYWLGMLHVSRIDWLGSSAWAPVSVIIVNSWKTMGFSILVYVAGLRAIPAEYHEAAIVDGAGAWARFRYVTLPLLSPTVLFLIVINTISAFQLFAEPRVLTQGGPGDASRSIVEYMYDAAFQGFNLGYASAIAVTLMVVLVTLTAIQFAVSRRWTFYS